MGVVIGDYGSNIVHDGEPHKKTRLYGGFFYLTSHHRFKGLFLCRGI